MYFIYVEKGYYELLIMCVKADDAKEVLNILEKRKDELDYI